MAQEVSGGKGGIGHIETYKEHVVSLLPHWREIGESIADELYGPTS